jgi:hypothetical protein
LARDYKKIGKPRGPPPPANGTCVLDMLIADHWTHLFQEHLNPADYIAMVHAWPRLLLLNPFLRNTHGPKNRNDVVQFLYRYGDPRQIRWFWSRGCRTTDYDQWMGFFASDLCRRLFPLEKTALEQAEKDENENMHFTPFLNDIHLRTHGNHPWEFERRHALIRHVLHTNNKALIEWCQGVHLFSDRDLLHPQCIQSYLHSVIKPDYDYYTARIYFDLRDYLADPDECLTFYQKHVCCYGTDDDSPWYLRYTRQHGVFMFRAYNRDRVYPGIAQDFPIVWPPMPDFSKFPMTDFPRWR